MNQTTTITSLWVFYGTGTRINNNSSSRWNRRGLNLGNLPWVIPVVVEGVDRRQTCSSSRGCYAVGQGNVPCLPINDNNASNVVVLRRLCMEIIHKLLGLVQCIYRANSRRSTIRIHRNNNNSNIMISGQ